MRHQAAYCALIASLVLCVSVPNAFAATPTWTLLNSPKAPNDALRWAGNAMPTDGRARGIWKDAQKRQTQLEKKMAQWADTQTPRGASERARIQAKLDVLNPVICRAKVRGTWHVGQLDERAGVCILFKKQDTRINCHNKRGPDCRHHLPVLSAEVFVLRGADKVVLTDINRNTRAMSAPFVAMVSLNKAIFGTTRPICRQGDVAGVLEREGPNLQCNTGGVSRASADSMLRGYADLEAYYATALAPVRQYIAANQRKLSSGMTAIKRLNTLEQAEEALKTFLAVNDGFNAGLRVAVKKVHPDAQVAAGKLVGDKVGPLQEKRDAYRGTLEAHIAELRIETQVITFWNKEVLPLVQGVQEIGARKGLPGTLAAAQDELKAIDALVAQLETLEPRVSALAPEVAKRLMDYFKAKAPKFEASAQRLEAREKRLSAFVALETAKADADELAKRIANATKTAQGFSGNAKGASKLVASIDGLLNTLDKALNTDAVKALKAHHATVLRPLRAPLISALEELEPALSGEERLQRLRLTYERIPDLQVTVDSSSNATAHAQRLMKSEDKAALQMEFVKAIAEYRNRIMTLIAERVDASFRCDMWQDCESQFDMKAADALVAGLYALPKSVKGRVKQRAGKALAAELKANGYGWQWPEDTEEEGDGFNGPWVTHKDGTLRKALKETLAAPVTLWLSCREEQLVGNYVSPKVLLKSCARAAKGLKGGPLLDDMKQAVEKTIEQEKHQMSAKECSAFQRKYRKAFFADALTKQCTELKDKEKREKAIAKWQKKIQSAIKRKKFGQAAAMLPDLEAAGAQDWMISNMERAIGQAAEYDRDRKARKAAEKRAKRLMSRLPSFESTCKAKKKSYLYADKQVRNAARRGRPQAAQRHEKKKWAAATKACEAKNNVLEVYQIYKSWGNDTAADAVLRAASTCMRFWRCN